MMLSAFGFAITAMLWSIGARSAPVDDTGDKYIKHCRGFVTHVETGTYSGPEETFCSAFVVGAAQALNSVGAICIIPANTAWVELVKTVIAYTDSLPPNFMSEKLGTLVTAALMQKWPCKKRP